MPLELPDNELKMLLACNGLVKKKPLSFALGTAGTGVLLVLRPRKKDPKAAMVKSAFKKALKSMSGPESRGKLVTWGAVTWEGGKAVLNGEKGFPSGSKKKIREFATDQKLKNFIKVLCKVDGEVPVDDESEDGETQLEAQNAENRALSDLHRAAPPIVEDPSELEALIEELLQEERIELAEEITQLREATSAMAPSSVSERSYDSKIEQIQAFGDPNGMLAATHATYVELCEELLAEIPKDHGQRAEVEALLKAARSAAHRGGLALSPPQEKAWSKLQGSVHYITMQMPALEKYIRSQPDPLLQQIAKSGVIQETLSFIEPIKRAVLDIGRATNPKQASQAAAALRGPLNNYTRVSGSERFQVLGRANPFPVPMPLDRLGEQAQTLLDTFSGD